MRKTAASRMETNLTQKPILSRFIIIGADLREALDA
jgi:hypothetical protein